MAASSSPRPVAVGETNVDNTKTPYVATLKPQQTTQNLSKATLKPIEFIHGEPTVRFTMEEREQFAREEGLHQAVIIKFAYGKPVLSELRKLLPKQFDVKGNCNIGQLDFRHLLIRFDLYEDFVHVLSSSYGYFKFDGEEYLFRIFLWTPSFNPKEETPKAWVWISLPELPTGLFGRRSLLSIATAAGKPIAVDKATQDRTRPSTARVKIILDLLDKHPNRVRLQFLEKESGKVIEHYQRIIYENLPLYCTHCKHQGHEENKCRLIIEKTLSQGGRLAEKAGRDVALMQPDSEASNMEQLKGDAREFLNSKRVAQKDMEKPVGDVGQQLVENHNSLATVVNKTDVVNRVSKLHGTGPSEFGTDTLVDSTSNSTCIGEEAVKEDVHESLDKALQHNEKLVHQAKEIVVATAMNTSEDIDGSLSKMIDNDLNKGTEAGSNENWNMVKRRKASSNVSPGSRSNFSNDLLCSNNFDVFLKDTGKDNNVMAPTLHISNPKVNKIIQECQAAMVNLANKPPLVISNTLAHEVPSQSLESFGEVQGESGQLLLSKENDKDLAKGMSSLSKANLTNELIISKEKKREMSASRWADLVDEEEQVSHPRFNGKLSPQALEFVPKSVIAKKNEPEAVASAFSPTNAYASDTGEDFFDEDDEDNMLDICFDKVARDGDISPRHQRSGSNKSKKKTHGRQHSWDGKVTEEFVPRNLPMRLAKQNHMTVSIDSTRSNKPKKK